MIYSFVIADWSESCIPPARTSQGKFMPFFLLPPPIILYFMNYCVSWAKVCISVWTERTGDERWMDPHRLIPLNVPQCTRQAKYYEVFYYYQQNHIPGSEEMPLWEVAKHQGDENRRMWLLLLLMIVWWRPEQQRLLKTYDYYYYYYYYDEEEED